MTSPGGQNSTVTSTVVLQANVDPYAQSMAQAQASTNQVAGAVDHLADKISNLAHAAGKKLIQFSVADVAGLTAGVASAALFEKQLGSLRATAAVTGQSIGGISRSVETAFTKFPVGRGQVIALEESLTSLGVSGVRNISSLTQTFIKLGAATGENSATLATGLVQLSRQLGNTNAAQIGNFANSLLTVSKNAGVSASGVLDFSSAIAPIARQAGIGEAAVLGISTAFSKAGADGFVASNTFNSIVNDITNLTRTGSPALAKYANFIGMTVAQFKKIPAADQITDIFTAIAKGGPQALSFVNELGLGTRGLTAVQGVAQSGGLASAIAQAQASAGDQGNLNKGSKAAFNDLTDSMSLVRNQFTEMGDLISAPLLPILSALAKGFAGFLGIINSVLKALGPLPALVGSLAAVIGPIAGVALTHAGAISTAALVRTVVGSQSGPRRALREGRDVAASIAAGGQASDYENLNDSAKMYFGPGKMPTRAKVAFKAGMGGKPGSVPTGPMYGPELPPMYGPERPPAEPRTGVKTAAGNVFRAAVGVPTYLANTQAAGLKASYTDSYNRPLYQPGNDKSLKENVASFNAETKARLDEGGVIKTVTMALKEFGVALLNVGKETIVAGGSMAASGAGRVAGAALGVEKDASKFSKVAQGAKSLAGMAAGSLFSPLGLATAGIPLGIEGYSLLKSYNNSKGQSEEQDNLDPLAKYNDQLGITTTTMANFTTSVQAASSAALASASATTTFKQAQSVSATDVQNYGGKGSKDKTIKAVGKGNVSGAEQLLTTYGITDPRQLDMFKQNLLGDGFTQSQTSTVLGSYKDGATPDYAGLAKTVAGKEGRGWGATHQSAAGSKIISSALTRISDDQQDAVTTGGHSAAYATTRAYGQALTFSSGLTGSNTQSGRAALSAELATLTGGKKGEFDTEQQNTFDPGKNASAADRQAYIVQLLKGTKDGKTYLAGVNAVKGATTDPTKIAATLAATINAPSDAAIATSKSFGALGNYDTTNSTVLAATGTESSSASVQQKAVEGLSGAALGASGNLVGAVSSLTKLSDSLGGADTATGALVASAAAWARTLQGFKVADMSTEGQVKVAAQTVIASRADALAPDATTATQDQYKSDLSAYNSDVQSYKQSLIQKLVASDAYGVQMVRAAQDNNEQIARSNRDFRTQETYSQQDFNLQRARSEQDFDIQMSRQVEDAAKSIYSPYTRVMADYTADAGTTYQNLLDQNQRIEAQSANLKKAAAEGLSSQAIETLDLANPADAQQTAETVQSIANDPSLAAKINKAVAVRVKATGALTQSSFSDTYTRTVADFNRDLDRTATDYETARTRAVTAQALTLNDMAYDYHKMITRSGQDLATSMKEIYGSYTDIYNRLTQSMLNNIKTSAPAAFQEMLTQIKAGKAAILASTTTGAANTTTAAKGPGSAYQSYAAQGQTTPYSVTTTTVVDYSGPTGTNTPGINPMTGKRYAHADGGISTFDHIAHVSEGNTAEAIIPLDQRGIDFMGSMYYAIARSVMQQMNVGSHPMSGSGSTSSVTHEDYSTTFTGDITIAAPTNLKQLTDQLAAKARLAKLAAPARSGK